MLSISDLKQKVVDGDFTLTKDQALDIPFIMNQKRGQSYEFDWKQKKVWISVWDLIFDIK